MPLAEFPVTVRVKLLALWTSLMFCYIYGDYFELYQPGKLTHMLAGRTALGPATPALLVELSSMMIIPAVMLVLTVVLSARICQIANVVLGLIYAGIVIAAIQGAWSYYVLFGLVEITLSLLTVFFAIRWSKPSFPG